MFSITFCLFTFWLGYDRARNSSSSSADCVQLPCCTDCHKLVMPFSSFSFFLLLVVCCRVILCWNYEFFSKSADCSEKCKGSAQFSVRFLLGFFVVVAAAAVAVLTKWIIRLSGILHFCWLCLQGSSFLILFLLFLFFYFIGFFSLQSFRLFYNLFSRRRRRLWRQLIIFAFSFL